MATRVPAARSKRDRSREGSVPRGRKKDQIEPAAEGRAAQGSWTAAAEGRAAQGSWTAVEKNGMDPEDHAVQAAEYRKIWQELFSSDFGDFEDTTKIPPMRFTDNPSPRHSFKLNSLQIFSVKIAEIKEGLQWPIHVFGTVALRDSVDRNRNVIFCRGRDNCQIVTRKDRSLALTGPSRAVVVLGSVNFEVELKVKGTTESEDKDLSYLAVLVAFDQPAFSCLRAKAFNGNLCTLEFTYGHLTFTVEATISVQVMEGSWHGFRGKFFACTASMGPEVLLLDSGDEEMPVVGDGKINLSRKVVSVEHSGKLIVFVKAESSQGDIFVLKEEEFTPKEASRSHGVLNVGFCKMRVTVAWSLLSGDRPTGS